jgi:ketosteroid isomerase-like protein
MGDSDRTRADGRLENWRHGLDAFNRRDKAAYLALADPEFELFPPAPWPETGTIRGREAIWAFIVKMDEPWEDDGSYEVIELIDGGTEKAAAQGGRHVAGKSNGVDTEFEYWNVVTFRDRKQLRSEWFTDRGEALGATGPRE